MYSINWVRLSSSCFFLPGRRKGRSWWSVFLWSRVHRVNVFISSFLDSNRSSKKFAIICGSFLSSLVQFGCHEPQSFPLVLIILLQNCPSQQYLRNSLWGVRLYLVSGRPARTCFPYLIWIYLILTPILVIHIITLHYTITYTTKCP